jgi:hypothetical protein
MVPCPARKSTSVSCGLVSAATFLSVLWIEQCRDVDLLVKSSPAASEQFGERFGVTRCELEIEIGVGIAVDADGHEIEPAPGQRPLVGEHDLGGL